MRFLKVGLIFSASTLSKLLAGLIAVKLIAVYIGADGLGRLGQFMSLMSIITIVAGGGISSGIIKYVAENKENVEELRKFLGAASLIMVVASLIIGLVLLVCAPLISTWLFGHDSYVRVIQVLAFAQLAIACSNYLFGLINGHKQVNAFAIITALSSVVGICGVILGITNRGMVGAMYGLMWMPACSVLFLIPWARTAFKFEWRAYMPQWDRDKVWKFLGFSLMLLVSAATMQLAQIVMRNIIESNSSWTEVGYWQAVVRVSDAYLQFITVVLANYYLPRLAELRSQNALRNEVLQAYRFAMPVLVMMGGSVYLCRDWIIALLFSKEFLPMREFFVWQLIGDVFKIAAYIGAYVAVAKARVKVYVSAEIYQAGLMVLLCLYFSGKYGAVGATYAYCTTYIIYLITVGVVLTRYLKKDVV